jgi:hypothetical protein
MSLSSSKHPLVDYIYLGITCVFFIGVLEWALIDAFGLLQRFYRIYCRILDQPNPTLRHSTQETGSVVFLGSTIIVMSYAILQYPLHLYSVVALRVSNQSHLQGDSENAWGFGQIVAMVLFGATLVECWKGYEG